MQSLANQRLLWSWYAALLVVAISLGKLQLCLGQAALACDDSCTTIQRSALVSLYAATNGQAWQNNTGWTEYVANPTGAWPPDAHCSWYGVLCCSNQQATVAACNESSVTGLYLEQNKLQGSLPASTFINLSWSLKYLSLSGNRLTGTLPKEIGLVLPLQVVNLFKNQLTGTLPPSLFQLPNLVSFYASLNLFSGTLPSLANATSLAQLYLESNSLQGTLPRGWADSPALKDINLAANKLSGTIPPIRNPPGDLTDDRLEHVILRENQFSGPIDSSLALVSMRELDLSSNQLSGTISAQFDNMVLLNKLDFSRNLLTGPLPRLRSSVDLQSVALGSNALTGTIPKEWEGFTQMSVLSVSVNRLRGALPAAPTWPQMRLLNTYASGLMQLGNPNLTAPLLPSYLTFQTAYGRKSQPAGHVDCYPVVPSKASSSLQLVILDPYYFGSQGCVCSVGYIMQSRAYGVLKCIPIPAQDTLLLIIVPACAVFLAVLVCTAYWMRKSMLRRYLLKWNRYRGPPEQGKPVTIVLTDVEGSTELWEAHHQAMSLAISVHDRIMRAMLSRYHGYETTTEGDAFILAFHSPIDAVAFCLATQQELMAAPWPSELLTHHTSCIRTARGEVFDWDEAAELDCKQVLHRGLRIRMGMSTGLAEHASIHELTKRIDYSGKVMDLAKAISETPSGGQIITDEATYTGIMGHMHAIAQEVHREPHWEAIQNLLWGGGVSVTRQGEDSLNPLSSRSRASSAEGQALIQSEASPFLTRSDTPLRMATHRKPVVAAGDDTPQNDAIRFLDMGKHILQGLQEPQQLFQMLVPGLEDRARYFGPLASVSCLSSGYFEAPGVERATLNAHALPRKGLNKLPHVTLVYCAIEGFHEMRAHDPVAADLAVTMYADCVRSQSSKRRGYKCFMQDTGCMLAFASPLDALQFCIVVQESMLDMPWDDKVCAMPVCSKQTGQRNETVFCGPRVKMCICEGRPDAITPHQMSGRASYAGTFVARVARLCQFAAHGGQILATWDATQSLLREWTGAVPTVPASGELIELLVRHTRATPTSPNASASTAPSNMSARQKAGTAASWSGAGEAHKLRRSLSPRSPCRRAQTAKQLKPGDPSSERRISTDPLRRNSTDPLAGNRASVQARLSADMPPASSAASGSLAHTSADYLIPLRTIAEHDAHSRRASSPGTLTNAHLSARQPPPPSKLAHAHSDAESVRPYLSSSAGLDFFATMEHAGKRTDPTAFEFHVPSVSSTAPAPPTVSRLVRQSGSVTITASAEETVFVRPSLRIPSEASSSAGEALDRRSTSGSSFGASLRRGSSPGDMLPIERYGQGSLQAPVMRTNWLASPLYSPKAVEGQQVGDVLHVDNPMFSRNPKVADMRRTSDSGSDGLDSRRGTDTGDNVEGGGRRMPRLAHIVQDAQHVLQDPWRSVQRVEIHHVGQLAFRGLPEPHTVMSITSGRLAARMFPADLPTKRVTMATPGQGLLYRLSMARKGRHHGRRPKQMGSGTDSAAASVSTISTVAATPRGPHEAA